MPLKWGILCAGRVSSDFVKALHITEGSEAIAVASRRLDAAREFAAVHGVPKAYGSYDELLADPEIDVVYVGSVAEQHSELATRCVRAGKATLVEKPMTLSARDTAALLRAARDADVFLMEGMWTRCLPAVKKLREIVRDDSLGRIVSVQADFGWSTRDCPYPDHRVWSSVSGGIIMDVAMYLAQLGQIAYDVSEYEVERVQAMGDRRNGVDNTTVANIMYARRKENGSSSSSSSSSAGGESDEKGFLQFVVTGDADTEERALIQGTKGRVCLHPPAHVPEFVTVAYDCGRGRPLKEEVYSFPLPDDSHETWNYPGSVGFTYQIRDVEDALRRGLKECPSFTHQHSLQLSLILDEILSQIKGNNSPRKDLDGRDML